MKKLFLALTIVAATFLCSCGVNYSMILNHNQNISQVQLNSNNFKVVDRVNGSSEVKYVFMIGGLKKRQLYEKAYTDMLIKANLLNSPKAVTNLITEEHFYFVAPFFIKRTVTVSANVIEFTR